MNRIYQVSGMVKATFMSGDRITPTLAQISETVESATFLGAAAAALAKWQAAGDYATAEWLTFPPETRELPEDQQMHAWGAAPLPGLESA